jgi:hypothetical protein
LGKHRKIHHNYNGNGKWLKPKRGEELLDGWLPICHITPTAWESSPDISSMTK